MKRLLLLFAAILMASTGMWAETVDYLYPVYNTDGVPTSGIKEWKTASVDATVVTDAATPVTWGTASTETWYVVTGTNVTLSKGAICAGDVHLILADGAKLTAQGKSGKPGIQVSDEGNYSLTIYGQTYQTGLLIATGEDGAAGIGGGSNGSGSNITINGGKVEATGGEDGAGIGGGKNGPGSNITINGGKVTATGGQNGGGIGGGYGGSGSNITINGGKVTANAGKYTAPTDDYSEGHGGTGIGGGNGGYGSNITINGGKVTATGERGGAGIGGGEISSGTNITINGGEVTANGGLLGGAGIGSGHDLFYGEVTCSGIAINGGKVTATGGYGAAGIGGGNGVSGSNVTINGGEIETVGGENGAGIGGGPGGSGSGITINGGEVTAIGGNDGYGIGNDESNDIKVANDLIVKAGVSETLANTDIVVHTSIQDIATKLVGKQYVTIEIDFVQYKTAAIDAIKAEISETDNEPIKAIATNAEAVINAATSIESINAVKAQAIAAIAYAKAAYSSAFGSLGEKQNGPAIEVIKDGERIILYRPDRVNFIRANN